MKKFLLFLLVSFLFITASFSQVYPTITSFSPTTAGPDDTITISGSNFDRSTQVRLAGAAVYSITTSPTTIKAVVGVYTGSGNVTVSNGGDSASLPGYTWNGYPVITSVVPTSAQAGDTVTITGRYLAPGGIFPIAPTVSFGGIAATSVTAPSYSVVKAVVGNGANGDIVLTTCCFGSATYNPGFSFLPAGSLTQDSLALVDLYNSTNGAGWTHNANWLTAAPLNTWYGVAVAGGRVIELTLTDNNLVGVLPSSLGNVTGLQALILDDNNLTGLVPASLNSLINVTQIPLDDNLYTYDGLEGLSTTKFSYHSQRTVFTIHNNNNLLSVSAGGMLSNNTYTWYKYDIATGSTVVATKPHDSTFLATVSGTYLVQIDNALAPEADFFSDTLHVDLLPIVPDPLTLDSLALVDLYNGTNGTGWIHANNWLTSAPLSTWYGVGLQSGRVQSLVLSGNNLVGTIPSSLGSLSDLDYLFLDNNKLSGSIPSSFSQLSTTYSNIIDLENNQLSGDLSPLIGAFSTQYDTDTTLHNNHFTFTSFENVIAPLVSQVGGFLSYGISPQANLQLDQNTYTNTLSVSAGGTLTNNNYKWYNGTTLAGTTNGDSTFTITTPGNYSVVVNNAVVPQLTLYSDTLNITVVPNWQDSLRQDSLALVDLYNSTNGPGWSNNSNWLTSAPLDEWYGVEAIENGRVSILELPENNLVGPIPSSFGNLTGLTELILEGNKLNGTIPASMANLSSLTEFVLIDNELTGIIPPTLNNLHCNYLQLDQNDFNFDALERQTPKETLEDQKTIPQITYSNGTLSASGAGGTLSNDTYTWYNNSNGVATIIGDSTFVPILSGDYTVNVTNAIATTTILYGNHLYVVVAPSLSQDSLALVDLYNATSGSAWTNNTNWLTNAPLSTWDGIVITNGRVTAIDLPNNNLNGTIPTTLGNITNLTNLDLDNNELTAGIPSSLGNLSDLTYLGLNNNLLGGSIPSSLGSLSNLDTLELTADDLNGGIPSSLGSLSDLTDLGLSDNQLTGAIPSSLGGLSHLVELQLANNKLNGAIPTELDNLNLIGLSLDSNQFTFEGMEGIIQAASASVYSPQAIIPVSIQNNVLYVSAGGSITNNTYNWYRNDTLVGTKTSDSTFTPIIGGNYSVTVTNAIATQLTLQSDTIFVVIPTDSVPGVAADSANIADTLSAIAVYPNPAHGVATIVFNEVTSGQYTIAIRSLSSGSVFTVLGGEATVGQNIIYQNIENYAPGIYVITLIDSSGKHHFKLTIE